MSVPIVAKTKYLCTLRIMKFQGGSCEDKDAHYMRGCVHAGASASTKWCTFVSREALDRSQIISGAFFYPERIPLSSATRLPVYIRVTKQL